MYNINERPSEKERVNTGDKPWWQPGLVLFSRMSGWIVGPIIIAIFVGKWLDKQFGTEPWLFLGLVGFSFIFSMIGIVKEGLTAMKKAEKEASKKGKGENSSEEQK